MSLCPVSRSQAAEVVAGRARSAQGLGCGCRTSGRDRDELRAGRRDERRRFCTPPLAARFAADSALTSPSRASEGLAASNPYRVAAGSVMIRGRSTACATGGAVRESCARLLARPVLFCLGAPAKCYYLSQQNGYARRPVCTAAEGSLATASSRIRESIAAYLVLLRRSLRSMRRDAMRQAFLEKKKVLQRTRPGMQSRARIVRSVNRCAVGESTTGGDGLGGGETTLACLLPCPTCCWLALPACLLAGLLAGAGAGVGARTLAGEKREGDRGPR